MQNIVKNIIFYSHLFIIERKRQRKTDRDRGRETEVKVNIDMHPDQGLTWGYTLSGN